MISALLVAVVGLSALARALSVPYPIVLVVGGALLGFVPGLPPLRLNPAVVLVVFLPPLLYGSAIYANVNDFRADLRWLALNTVPLVLATMGTVALVAHALIPGLPWAAAFVLGAIVSPTDPLAAATIMRRLGAPRRIVSAVEGEGLFNDATALVAYRVAIAAVVAGSFSLAHTGLTFRPGRRRRPGYRPRRRMGRRRAPKAPRRPATQRHDLAAHRLRRIRARRRPRSVRRHRRRHSRHVRGCPRPAHPAGAHAAAERLRLGNRALHRQRDSVCAGRFASVGGDARRRVR